MFAGGFATHATTTLREYAFNIDGTITDTFNPPGGLTAVPGVTYGTFDPDTGLGSLLISVAGAGAHDIRIFFEHDLDPIIDDETGSAVGAPRAGQSWEIDEPGYANNGYAGNIWDNFSAGSLDNAVNSGGTGAPNSLDDMAMALGWSFVDAGDLWITLSETAPASGFYLRQDDALGGTLFLSGVLSTIPEASTWGAGGALLSLVAAGWYRRRMRSA